MTKFRNAILCEDIRDEIGGKNSLMGVLTGEVVVPSFPAAIQIAIFMQYFPDKSDGEHLSAVMRLMQDDTEIVKLKMEATIPLHQIATFILPRGVMAFEKEVSLRILVAMNDGPEEEVLVKKIMKQSTA